MLHKSQYNFYIKKQLKLLIRIKVILFVKSYTIYILGFEDFYNITFGNVEWDYKILAFSIQIVKKVSTIMNVHNRISIGTSDNIDTTRKKLLYII